MVMKTHPWKPGSAPAQAAPERVLHWSPEVGYRLGNSVEPGACQLATAILLACRCAQIGMPFSIWNAEDKEPLITWDGSYGERPVYHKPELKAAMIEVMDLFVSIQNSLLERVRADFAVEMAQFREAAAVAPETPATGSEMPPDSASEAPIDSVSDDAVQSVSEQSSAPTAPTTSVTG